MPPERLVVEGATYHHASQPWIEERITSRDCQDALIALAIDMPCYRAIQLIADYVEQHSPVRGHEVVAHVFGPRPEGIQNINMTTLFKYAVRQGRIFRYKLNLENEHSPVIFYYE